MLGNPVEKNAIAPIAITPRSMTITLVFRFVPFLARELRIQSSCNQTLLPGQSGLSKTPINRQTNEKESWRGQNLPRAQVETATLLHLQDDLAILI